MFRTYIYGTSRGFNFYEDENSLISYFQGFYNTYGKGRQLIINRRNNGVTFYNYLIYDLADQGGRPNSFFGMSISMDNYDEYTNDFKELFKWFDFLFDKLVERGVLFSLNQCGVIQYNISKFSNCANEINWLKNNIPNFFTKKDGVRLDKYEKTFSTSSFGQIPCVNYETSTEIIIKKLRMYSWVALSPDFKIEEEITLNLSEVKDKISDDTKRLLVIANKVDKNNLKELHSIKDNCESIIKSIEKYLSADRSDNERNDCSEILEDAKFLVEQAEKIVHDKTIVPHPVAPEDSYKDKPTSNTRECTQCKRNKDIADFPKGSNICHDCVHKKGILTKINPIKLGVGLFLLILSVFLFTKYLRSDGRDKSGSDNPEQTVSQPLPENEKRIISLIDGKKFMEAYNEIEANNGECDSYLSRLKKSVEEYMSELIANPDNGSKSEEIDEFRISNRRVIDGIGLDFRLWKDFAEKYDELKKLSNKESLSLRQRRKANDLIDWLLINHPLENQTALIESLRTKISSLPDDPSPTVHEYFVVITDSETITIDYNRGFDRKKGEAITLRSSQKLKVDEKDKDCFEIKKTNNDKEVTITVKTDEAGKKVVIRSGEKAVTITSKSSFNYV